MERDSFRSRRGFIIACIGSAVGMGNIWLFPARVSAFGGAAFVGEGTPPLVMYFLFALAGVAWATINVNSFPMVVELAGGGDVGRYTGYYYTASMAAQIVTPVLSGFLMDQFGMRHVLFPYAAVFCALSFLTMFFVRHGDARPTPKTGIEALHPED